VTVSFVAQKLFLLDAEPFEFGLGSRFLYLSVPVYFLLLFGVISVSGPILKALIYFELIFVQGER
jgi:hypothetical protein